MCKIKGVIKRRFITSLVKFTSLWQHTLIVKGFTRLIPSIEFISKLCINTQANRNTKIPKIQNWRNQTKWRLFKNCIKELFINDEFIEILRRFWKYNEKKSKVDLSTRSNSYLYNNIKYKFSGKNHSKAFYKVFEELSNDAYGRKYLPNIFPIKI